MLSSPGSCKEYDRCCFRKRGDFPAGPVAKTLSSPCRGPRFDPWSGISHAATKFHRLHQRSEIPCATTKALCSQMKKKFFFFKEEEGEGRGWFFQNLQLYWAYFSEFHLAAAVSQIVSVGNMAQWTKACEFSTWTKMHLHLFTNRYPISHLVSSPQWEYTLTADSADNWEKQFWELKKNANAQ